MRPLELKTNKLYVGEHRFSVNQNDDISIHFQLSVLEVVDLVKLSVRVFGSFDFSNFEEKTEIVYATISELSQDDLVLVLKQPFVFNDLQYTRFKFYLNTIRDGIYVFKPFQ